VAEFKRSDHKKLADLLKYMKGKYLLSINDLPETREIYGKSVNITKVDLMYSASRTLNIKGAELLVTNYEFR